MTSHMGWVGRQWNLTFWQQRERYKKDIQSAEKGRLEGADDCNSIGTSNSEMQKNEEEQGHAETGTMRRKVLKEEGGKGDSTDAQFSKCESHRRPNFLQCGN